MAFVLGILLFIYWLFVPTLLSAVLPPAGKLGRDGTAVLLAIASWAVLWFFVPIKVWPPRPLALPLGPTVLIALAALYLALFAAGLRPRTDKTRDAETGGSAVTIALLSPVSEELLFRGFLLAIALPPLGGYGAVAFSALLFLAAHEVGRIGGARRSLREALADLVFALLAGVLFLVSGTILAPLVLHILVNGLYAYGARRGSS